jgi:protoporphyrinogen oxidase
MLAILSEADPMANSGPRKRKIVILGGGVTGFADGIASGSPVFEALDAPGGICSSSYMRPGQTLRLRRAPKDGEAYRFEIGGGRWISGGEPSVLNFLNRLVPMKRCTRRFSIHSRRLRRTIPYPLQNHLRYLNSRTAGIALRQMEHAAVGSAADTMSGWLEKNFGSALYRLFLSFFMSVIQRAFAPRWLRRISINRL